MNDLAIIADDLTGAVDAAAPFARDVPVDVFWSRQATGRRYAVSTSSRDVDETLARCRVDAALVDAVGTKLVFKKIDSLLRGNSLVEIAQCCLHSTYASVVITPAFPDQGRIVREGSLHASGSSQPPAPIRIALPGRRAVSPVGPDRPWPERGIVLCDAETPADMADIVVRARRMDRPILWCGSAGLARALATAGETEIARPRPDMIVIGSRHEASRRHVDALSSAPAIRVLTVREPDDIRAAEDGGKRQVITFDPADGSLAGIDNIQRQSFRRLSERDLWPAVLVVVGGDTLLRVVESAGVDQLVVLGEWAPGVALTRAKGGSLDERFIYTKAGAFDDLGLFDSLLKPACLS